jgi:hypothetical protein
MEEYIYCINKNIDNPAIEKIYLVHNIEEYNSNPSFFTDLLNTKLKDVSKVTLVPSLNSRFIFNDLPKYVESLAPENAIVAVSNLDIFIPDIPAWKNIEEEFFSRVKNDGCLALCRMEYINDVWQYIEEAGWSRGEFADCWVFKTPLKFTSNDFPFDVAVGNAPSCDNFMFGFLSKHYKLVFNWASKYIVYHFDLVRKPKKLLDKYNIMVFNDKTLNIPNNEFSHTLLSPYYDWERILNRKFPQNEK